MRHVLYLAWRYLRHHCVKTAILVASLTVILFLPVALYVVVEKAGATLTARAESTPLLVGAKGSAVDLALSALYFRAPNLEPIRHGEVERVQATGLAVGIPLHLRYSAGEHRIVGTTVDYLDHRGLATDRGRRMAFLGECVLGAAAARRLDADVGGHVLSSPAGAFDVAGSFPLRMPVVGVLAPAGTPDDEVVFVDVRTAWVISGLAHGHEDVRGARGDDGRVIERTERSVSVNATVLSYTEITDENRDSFHFHGDPAGFPIDAVLAVPRDRRSRVLLRGRYEETSGEVQMIVPTRVIDGLMDTVFSVRNHVLLGSLGVGLATLVTAALVFALSIALRRREIETIRKIGGSARRVRAVLATEVVLVVGTAVLLAGGLTAIVSAFSHVLVRALG